MSNQSLSVFEAAPHHPFFPLVLLYISFACFIRFVSLINNELTSCTYIIKSCSSYVKVVSLCPLYFKAKLLYDFFSLIILTLRHNFDRFASSNCHVPANLINKFLYIPMICLFYFICKKKCFKNRQTSMKGFNPKGIAKNKSFLPNFTLF